MRIGETFCTKFKPKSHFFFIYSESKTPVFQQTISAATSTDEEDRVKAELDEQQADIKKYANKVRSRLKQIQTQIEQEEQAQRQQAEDEQMLPNTADEKTTEIRMKKTQHSAMSRKFINVMSRYGQAQNEFRDACKEKMRRQIEIMGENVDDAKLEDMLSSGETAPLFAGGIVMDTQKSKQVLDDIQSRKNDILALEKSIKELHDLFVDMAMLVQEQGEMIDRVEYRMLEHKRYVEISNIFTTSKYSLKHSRMVTFCWFQFVANIFP